MCRHAHMQSRREISSTSESESERVSTCKGLQADSNLLAKIYQRLSKGFAANMRGRKDQ